MSVVGKTSALRVALAQTLTDGGVACLPYDTWTIGSSARAAIGVDPEWDLTIHPQGGRMTGVVLPVLVYTTVTADTQRSQQITERCVEEVVDALSADPSVGNHASGVQLEGRASTILYRDENGQMIVVVTIPVLVYPR